jgi:glutamate dehydrogenase/leucine dehydrogenase
VSDISGGLYNPEGLDIPAITAHVTAQPEHLLEGYEAPGVKVITNAELLTCDVDVLIPAALEHQIRADNAPDVQARMIIEAANGPLTHEADEILNERGTVIVPDILANAGGVTVSYLEWVQDIQVLFWTEEEVNNRLQTIMEKAFDEVWEFSAQMQVPLRLGAMMLAVNRVANAVRSRGLFP